MSDTVDTQEELTMCQAVNELFADEIAELKIKMDSELAKKDAQLEEKTAQIAYLQAELLKYKSSASVTE